MNRLHRWYCQSDHWRQSVQSEILPWALHGINLGDAVLEAGPGPGVTTDWLRHRVKQLDALEIDSKLSNSLQRRFAKTNVIVQCGDATHMPYDDCRFSAVVSFTMLHHIPTPELQDRFFQEACRTLKPGGIFAGVDSLPSVLMRLFHLGDTMTLVSPDTLASRLLSAGFTEPQIHIGSGRFRFSARRH
jgi:SAM-dependent methyltransferase